VREISASSLSEIAMKSARGKLAFSPDDLKAAMTALYLRVLPYTVEHASRLFDLPLHHGDLFDRILISTRLN
jgi:PIN domain nuclease of toxin-antitoxin system